ncbi:MAG: hypothetical protein M9915_04005 [Rhizobacter sp.]|nr:hypothetical protein [Rhizobacter sp.]
MVEPVARTAKTVWLVDGRWSTAAQDDGRDLTARIASKNLACGNGRRAVEAA